MIHEQGDSSKILEDVGQLNIVSPKQRDLWNFFPFYAGFSRNFARNILGSVKVEKNGLVLDPWNGSGTTTWAAASAGFRTLGLDLNPVMVVVAKARMLSRMEESSLRPLAVSLLKRVDWDLPVADCDPLLDWLDSHSAQLVRAVETALNEMLVSPEGYKHLTVSGNVDALSPLASFFYVALFKAFRLCVESHRTSNPTWTRRPRAGVRTSIKKIAIEAAFLQAVITNAKLLTASAAEGKRAKLRIGDSRSMEIESNTVQVVLTSPPYCTRLDYAVASSPELALLRSQKDQGDKLRRSLIGSTAIRPTREESRTYLGERCEGFLDQVATHRSIASGGYYFKTHLQYYSDLHTSIAEISRVLKPGGLSIIVIQDSYYKDVHNDVPEILIEMAERFGLHAIRRQNFSADQSFVKINSRARRYVKKRKNVESAICFFKS